MKDIETESKIKAVLDKHEICYLYNETFNRYNPEPMKKGEAVERANSLNQCKGGHWLVHPKGQYEEAYKACMFIQEMRKNVSKHETIYGNEVW